MSFIRHPFFTSFAPGFSSSEPPTTSFPSHVLPTRTSEDGDLLPSSFSPVISSPVVHPLCQPQVTPSLQAILANLDTQMRAIADRLDHANIPYPSTMQSIPVNVDSRPASTQSIRLDPPSDTLHERFLRIEAEYHRLRLELAAQPHTNNNNLTASNTINLPSPQCSPSSAFHPIIKPPSSDSASFSPHLIIHPQPVNVNTSPNHHSTISSSINVQPQPMLDSPNIIPTSIQPSSSLPSNAMLKPNLTINLHNNLPTFKGLAHERPIQFINDFELRASALVGSNDSSLLQTVQQALSDGALIWFGQVQKSPEHITTWLNFKTRFYERYHTPAKVQNLRTELRLLFQGDTESTLDYFDRLKTLMIEIDPSCHDNWLKHKFIQKLRSDVRTRLDVDLNLPIRDIVRKAQHIESNIEQQKVDEKLKLAANHEKKNLPTLVTNNLSISTHPRPTSPTYSSNNDSSITYPRNDHLTDDFNRNSNHNNTHRFNNHQHHNNFSNDRRFTNRTNQHPAYPTNNSNSHNHNHNQHLNTPPHNFNHNRNNPNNHHYPDHRNSNTDCTNNHNRDQHPNHHNINNNHNYINRNTFHNNNHPHIPSNYQRSNSNHPNQRITFPRHSPPPSINSNINNPPPSNNKNRWWCPHCQRHGHSWERCPSNPDGINFRFNSTSHPRPSSPPPLSSSQPSSFINTNTYSEN